MRLRTSFFILMASIAAFVATSPLLSAKESSPQEITLQKARAVQLVNFVREVHGQRPLVFVAREGGASLARVAAGSGAIAGRLIGLDQSAIHTAWVVAWSATADSGRADGGIGTIESSGDYKISDLPAGDYYVLASAEGYYLHYYMNALNFSDATPVTVAENTVTEGIDFELEKIQPGTGSVSGVVRREADGAPIAGARITVYSPDNPYFIGSAESSANGEYKITSLKSGKYYAQVLAEAYLPEYYDNADDLQSATRIEVVEPNETSGINFDLGIGGIISGTVTSDEGAPIAGAYVQTASDSFDAAGVIARGGWAVTDETGAYQITGLASGDYLVLAYAWSQWYYASEWYDNAASFEEATPVHVNHGEVTSGIDFQLSLPSAKGSIAGRVLDLHDQPIAGAYVYAQSPFADSTSPATVYAYAVSEHDGSYRIENLPDGSYLVSASAFSQWQYVTRWWPDAETPDDAEPVIVDSHFTRIPIDFHLPLETGNASIAGTVRSDDGRPLANAFIDISSGGNAYDPATGVVGSGRNVWAYATSDSNGYYRVDQLPPGEYVVHAQYWENFSFGQEWYDNAGDAASATPVKIAAGEAREGIDFSLSIRPFYGTIAGTVTDEVTGEPINRAYVEISPVGWDFQRFAPFRAWPYYAVTDETGGFKLDWLLEGEYVVSVYADRAFEYFENAVVPDLATPVKVIGGESTTIDFGLTRRNEGSGVIAGRVGAEYTDQLLEIAVVVAKPAATWLVWPQSEMFFNTVIDPDGAYEITGLPAGDYYVYSFAPGYMTEYFKDQFDPALAEVVHVDGITPATGIDFSLMPIMYLLGPVDGVAGGGSVYGKVTNADGKPMPGATVYAFNGEGQAVSSARCFTDGGYEMQGLPPGSYRLQASNIGYESQCNGGADNLRDAAAIELGRARLEVNFVLDPKTITDVEDQPLLPRQIELYGNYPNPFNPETRISFGLPRAMRVKVRVFNLLGEEVKMLFDGMMNAGGQHLTWDGRDRAGKQLSSGLYFYRLESPEAVLVGRMMMAK